MKKTIWLVCGLVVLAACCFSTTGHARGPRISFSFNVVQSLPFLMAPLPPRPVQIVERNVYVYPTWPCVPYYRETVVQHQYYPVAPCYRYPAHGGYFRPY